MKFPIFKEIFCNPGMEKRALSPALIRILARIRRAPVIGKPIRGLHDALTYRVPDNMLRRSITARDKRDALYKELKQLVPQIEKKLSIADKVRQYAGGGRTPGEEAAFRGKYLGLLGDADALRNRQFDMYDQASNLLSASKRDLRNSIRLHSDVTLNRDIAKGMGRTSAITSAMGVPLVIAVNRFNQDKSRGLKPA